MKWGTRVLIGAGALFFGALGLCLGGMFLLHESHPVSAPSAEADALARQMVDAVNAQAWDNTGAVSWTFAGYHQHLWDRERNVSRYTAGKLVVLVDLDTQTGLAWKKDQPLTGIERDKAVATAWESFCNDSFWLNPVTKAFDPGTSRSIVTLSDGSEGLMVEYSSGGVSPGDAYVYILGPDNVPTAWKMWVSIIPFGGVDSTFEAWQTLPTGALIATSHQTELGLSVDITDLNAAATLEELEPIDPFAPLFAEAREAE